MHSSTAACWLVDSPVEFQPNMERRYRPTGRVSPMASPCCRAYERASYTVESATLHTCRCESTQFARCFRSTTLGVVMGRPFSSVSGKRPPPEARRM